MIIKLLMDLTTDEYGKDFDVVNFEATLSFFLGVGMFVLNALHPAWFPGFDLLRYAGGVSALLTATSAAQRIKPPAQPPQEG